MIKDFGNYKFGFLYWNPSDKKVFVPKRIPFMGYTLNFANPFSYVFLIAIILLIILINSIS